MTEPLKHRLHDLADSLRTWRRRRAATTVLVMSMTAMATMATLAATAAEPATASTLEQIQRTGVLRIGYWDALPFSYRDETRGTVVGYSIDVCKRIADELKTSLGMPKLEIQYVAVTISNRIRLLDAGAYDLECSASTNTEERRRSVLFTALPHFFTRTHYMALTRSGLHTVEDLRGRSVSAVLGSTNIGRIGQLGRERRLNLAVLPTASPQEAFDAVTQGRVSAAVMDSTLLSAMAAQSRRPQDYALSTESLAEPAPYGLMMRLDDREFARSVDAALRRVLAATDMATLYEHWFMRPLPGMGINLRMPMPPELQEVIDAARR